MNCHHTATADGGSALASQTHCELAIGSLSATQWNFAANFYDRARLYCQRAIAACGHADVNGVLVFGAGNSR